MIHEIRTYNLKTNQLEEYWKRFGFMCRRPS